MGPTLHTYRRFAALGAVLLLGSLAVPFVQTACAAAYEIVQIYGPKDGASAQHEGMQDMPCTGRNGQGEQPSRTTPPACCSIQATPAADRPVTAPSALQVPSASVNVLPGEAIPSSPAWTSVPQPFADPPDGGGAVPARVLFSVFLI